MKRPVAYRTAMSNPRLIPTLVIGFSDSGLAEGLRYRLTYCRGGVPQKCLENLSAAELMQQTQAFADTVGKTLLTRAVR